MIVNFYTLKTVYCCNPSCFLHLLHSPRWQQTVSCCFLSVNSSRWNGCGPIWMCQVTLHLHQCGLCGHRTVHCFLLEYWRWISPAGHPHLCVWSCTSFIPLSLLVMPTLIIHAYYAFIFFIFHGFGVISLFRPSPVQFGFVVFVWIFNGCKWKVHGCSTLNVVIHMIGERRERQNSISSDLFCFCLWAVFSAELRADHSSNSYNYICECLASKVFQTVCVCMCVCVWLQVCAFKDIVPRKCFSINLWGSETASLSDW